MEEETKTEHGHAEAPQNANTAPAPLTKTHNSSLGPILGVLLILLVIIFSGLYLWGAALNSQFETEQNNRTIPNNEPETVRAVADTQILETVSSSDSLEAIEADVNSTILDSLDAELDEIDRELTSALDT
jgi:uncharacterized protein HemX